MSETIKIRKGLDIKLKGKADKIFIKAPRSKTYAIKPPDFQSLTPKIVAKPCTQVKVGSVIFYDKYRPEIKFTSPVDISTVPEGIYILQLTDRNNFV